MSEDTSFKLAIQGVDLWEKAITFKRKQQQFFDRIQGYVKLRWLAFATVIAFFGLRIYVKQGYAFLAYCLGLWMLTRTVLFLRPAHETDTDLSLPVHETDEFKGFARKLPEMQYWKSLMTAALLTSLLSCFEFSNVEAVWQVLVFYFVVTALWLTS